ncbi:hypothetical protein EV641_109201 [Rhodococcus sp. SMB37]|uniref:hypothetical protein n=1 Tax=Rhodococcus sp. SMB37 TaxID=2512213 RepID=UPI001045188E|nr:hypothetical protein [Rhodococcus sp. SMB37]TCN51810.1 hypothetical protein EV641_109201 [Rhodococcus sp. SMB37]
MYLGEEPRTTPQAEPCGWIAPVEGTLVYCQRPTGHPGIHISGDLPPITWTSIGDDRSHVERLETGIAATVREIDELRAENTRLRKLIDGVAAVLGVHITIGP